eukprot:TRINITY_DN73576_c0_g1_i1.p1 TRINITY_DN73576_c0_g1~~TRINITY_DN73576_c0_g1_i1.p1  ORF type:complete len:629 (-),score=70.55 TRINITY_DN73576_c0_g1_i1:115-1941(-)
MAAKLACVQDDETDRHCDWNSTPLPATAGEVPVASSAEDEPTEPWSSDSAPVGLLPSKDSSEQALLEWLLRHIRSDMQYAFDQQTDRVSRVLETKMGRFELAVQMHLSRQEARLHATPMESQEARLHANPMESPPAVTQCESQGTKPSRRTLQAKQSSKRIPEDRNSAAVPRDSVERCISERNSRMRRSKSGVAFRPAVEKAINGLKPDDNSETPVNFGYQIVQGKCFSLMSAFVIGLNAVYIGFQVDTNVRGQVDRARGNDFDSPDWFVPDTIFCVVFSIELVLRISFSGRHFLKGPEGRWNIFDTALVIVNIVELSLQGLLNASILRSFRMVRLVRILTVFRKVPMLRQLQTMMVAIGNTIPVLIPALSLFLYLMYMAAIVIAQGVEQLLVGKSTADRHIELLILTFGSVSAGLETCFVSILGGIDWYDLLVALRQAGLLYALVFTVYVSFVMLAAMNIVTGIFVDTARGLAEVDRDLSAELEMEREMQAVRELIYIFEETSANTDAKLELSDFKAHFENDRNRALLRSIGLDITNLKEAFHLIDRDGEGRLAITDFVEGCMRLRGTAKTVDLQSVRLSLDTALSCLEELLQLDLAPARSIEASGG